MNNQNKGLGLSHKAQPQADGVTHHSHNPGEGLGLEVLQNA